MIGAVGPRLPRPHSLSAARRGTCSAGWRNACATFWAVARRSPRIVRIGERTGYTNYISKPHAG
eukprot:5241177-Alexandrium_andersonii.AAC.1